MHHEDENLKFRFANKHLVHFKMNPIKYADNIVPIVPKKLKSNKDYINK